VLPQASSQASQHTQRSISFSTNYEDQGFGRAGVAVRGEADPRAPEFSQPQLPLNCGSPRRASLAS
jgi:hypothetical protein